MVYLSTSGNESERVPFWCVSTVCLVLGIAARRDIARLFHARRVRQATGAYGFLLLWTLLILGMIRSYSGGTWFGDWLEHFQRCLFFLHHFPLHTVILGNYPLPARPPMMNVLGAFFLAQSDDRFELFQLIFTFLNLLLFLPCCLIMPAFGGARRPRILPLLCLFALNPVVIENATYSWTKMFCAFYLVLAICLYLAGWRKRDRGRMTAAFLALSAGILVHYSGAPYLLLLSGHYLFFVFPSRRRKWREMVSIAALCTVLLLVWLGWSVKAYGMHATLESNTAVTLSRQYQGNTAVKVAANLFDSLVPALIRDPSAVQRFDQPSTAGAIRDNVFAFYQPNLIFGMGLVGGPLVLSLLYGVFERRKGCQAEGRFWLVFVPCCVLAGIMVVGERDSLGDAHLTLLSLEAMGLALVAGTLPMRRALAVALVAGSIADFSLGILLQARVENLENTPGAMVFSGLTVADGKFSIGQPGPDSLSGTAWRNWYRKHQFELSRRWVAELGPHVDQEAEARQLAAELKSRIEEDRTAWYGWYSRHGGSVGFLGDHVAQWPMVSGGGLLLLLGLFAGLIKKLWECSG
jgi:4-amino-4-deoxy-L-arabinose transferase-like glycosyltransferase